MLFLVALLTFSECNFWWSYKSFYLINKCHFRNWKLLLPSVSSPSSLLANILQFQRVFSAAFKEKQIILIPEGIFMPFFLRRANLPTMIRTMSSLSFIVLKDTLSFRFIPIKMYKKEKKSVQYAFISSVFIDVIKDEKYTFRKCKATKKEKNAPHSTHVSYVVVVVAHEFPTSVSIRCLIHFFFAVVVTLKFQ